MRFRAGVGSALGAALVACLLAGLLTVAPGVPAPAQAAGASYTNPLRPTAGTRTVTNCPDPHVFRGAGGQARSWFMVCTSDPIDDRDAAATPRVSRTLPMLRSEDLVHWRYVGAATSARPSWAAPGASLWAPDVTWSPTRRRYYMTFGVTDVKDRVSGQPGCARDRAIGVAVATRPTGPWTPSPTPVVAPRRLGPGCDFAATIDPHLLEAAGTTPPVLYFGSFAGGVLAAPAAMTATGMRLTARARAVTTTRRFEAPDVVRRDGWYYLTVSTGDCCNGALSGYAVVTARSRSPYGPFLDRDGVSLLDRRPGGTPVLASSGNRWVGPGHTSTFVDRGGQWWTVYHAVDEARPFLSGGAITRRPPMLDPVDWVGGWPAVRAGRGASSTPVPVPAAQAGQRSAYRPSPVLADPPRVLDADRSDELDGDSLSDRWTWVRPPAPEDVVVAGGVLRLRTHLDSLYAGRNDAPLLLQDAPEGDYVVETRVSLERPAGGAPSGTQAGLVVHADDDRYLKLVHAVAGEIEQVGFVREASPTPRRIGITTVGPPGTTTWLRLVHTTVGAAQLYRADSSRDGVTWTRGATWRADDLGTPRIGLVAGGGEGSTATFDHLRVWSLRR
ncbi:hypothetical protein ASG49_09475 [Marmoricola sp. Leaf446]|uniref:family 43 glycosylhydrolase n=1 Tax=Marmoricola sp. Leaf446 TaxID=1736379 RepID=UPI0007018FC5|nr:family 43 glycosylhydrolase [Marmoricola sp. Leaf446]KQT92170.1 hypothetical protein ASG49_09475 [Marmoricola sp. Leaf446]